MKRFCTKVAAFVLGASMIFGSTAYAAPSQWSAGNAYPAGSQVSYNGTVYEAKWWSQNEEPGSNTWGAWKEITGATDASTGDNSGSDNAGGSTGDAGTSTGIPKWDASTIYTGGNQVVYNNIIYEAKWWVTGETP